MNLDVAVFSMFHRHSFDLDGQGDVNGDAPNQMTVLPSGRVHTTGHFSGDVTLGSTKVKNAGSLDFFVSVFDL